MTTTLDFEVSDYLANKTALIPINLADVNSEVITTNLINSKQANLISLDIQTNSLLTDLLIHCASKCEIEILKSLHKIKLNNLNLVNAVLVAKPDLSVNDLKIQASEDISTFLPNVINNAEIRVLPSEDILAVQQLLSAVNIIPGSGEYVYDPEVQYDVHTNKPINVNNNANIADSLYNLESLDRNLPNIKWVAPVVSWFAVSDNNKLDIENLTILPAVEKREESISDPWHVADFTRVNAHEISKDHEDRPNYGGTINDASLIRYIDSLRDSGYQIMFYPMIFLDLPDKPWRGHISANDPDNIYEFFNKNDGYNTFILHYAKLLKGKIDAFIIGSELKNLTQIVDNEYHYPDPKHYPAVSELISLAQKVREIVGNDIVITYAADWSEYHHDNFGYHHLDSLWASEYIDIVGIDAYFPVTNKQKGDISLSEIKQGFESGEFWDYYYDNNEKKPLSPQWAIKQIEYWWGNEHYASGIKSEWQPKMKPIWFTEFGFPSIHMATNQPNVFWNPDSIDGGVPKYSSGNPDAALQMRSIRAMLEHFQEKSEMVQNMFLWAWDARPYPAYPERLDVWSDGGEWSRSHSINGKIEPLCVMTILPNFTVNTSLIYADKLIIDSSLNNNAKLIIANNVAFKKSCFRNSPWN